MPREWGLRGLPPVGAACAGRKPLRRCGASSPYTGEPKRRRPKPPLCTRRVSEANLEVKRFGEKAESYFGK